jgi:transcriptional regulator with XRE-family HTH domain
MLLALANSLTSFFVTTPTSSLLREIHRRSRLSQAELARRAGLPRSVINTYLRGHREAGTDALSRIAAAGGLELRLAPRTPPVDPERAGRRLAQVLDLAEALPFKRERKLRYPKLPAPAASRGPSR